MRKIIRQVYIHDPLTEEEYDFIKKFLKPSDDGNYYLNRANLQEALKKARKKKYPIPQYFDDNPVNKLDRIITRCLLEFFYQNEK